MTEDRKTKVLVVDDDAVLTGMLETGLRRHGYVVRVENFSSRAVNATREFAPDLILLDVDMPEPDGGDIARQIQGDRDLKQTSIIFLTSLARKEEVEVTGGRIGGDAVIAKPVQIAELVRKIEEHLAKRAP